MKTWWWIAVAAAVTACNSVPAPQTGAGGIKTGLAQQEARASQRPAQPSDSLARLIRGLAQRPGEFVQSSTPDDWDFTGDRRYFDAFAAFGDTAVVRLVACIGDSTPVAAKVDGRPASMGAMCYEALTHMAYYEAYEDRPDDENKYAAWEGDITPTATATELLRAQRAWQGVVRARTYSFL